MKSSSMHVPVILIYQLHYAEIYLFWLKENCIKACYAQSSYNEQDIT